MMDTLRRSLTAVNRCIRIVWNEIKENCLCSCFGGNSERPTSSQNDDYRRVVDAVAEKTKKTAPTSSVSSLIDRPKEMRNELDVFDRKKGRLQRSDAENDEKKKRKTARRRGNGKSREAIKSLRAERVSDTVEGGEKRSFDPRPSSSLQKFNKKVRSYLNKITAENTDVLMKGFAALPINTVERLENVVDLVFERAIQEQTFAPCCAALCSALQSVRVRCTECEKTTSFKLLVIKKCQSLFESDKAHQKDSAKKLEEITSCANPEKKKKLQNEYEEYRRRFRNRFIGNCRLIGEMFNRHLIHPKIMLYCIQYLIHQHSEEPLECLCNLLKTTGKELEEWCDLNSIFGILADLTAVKTIPRKTRIMIQDVLDLRKNKWSPKLLDSEPGTTDEEENISRASGDSKNRHCRDTGSINNTTLSQGDKVVADGVSNSHKCNRSGVITRDFKDNENCYGCDDDGHLARNCSKSASAPPYPNFRRKERLDHNRPDGRAERGSGSGGCNSVFHTRNKVDRSSRDCTERRDKPVADKSTEPTLYKSPSGSYNFRKIIIPSNLTKKFLEKAQSNTLNNIETCGILAGKLSSNYLILTHLIIPKQNGTSDSCNAMNEEDIFEFQYKQDLITLGWIHTHPTQTSFMSSIDLHTQYSYQLMVPEAIAIVCAPKYNESNFFFLTPNHGLQIIADCNIFSGFHAHDTNGDIYAVAEHCVLYKNLLVNVVDLR